MYNSLYKESL
jgi:14-3-3 protein epsilon